MEVRKADFAGSWYPAGESDCRKTVEGFSKSSTPCPGEGEKLVGGIVPHAGWFYSGQIAFNVMQCLSLHQKPDTCIIFGRHLHPGGGNFIMQEGRWATPFGELEIDDEIARELVSEFTFTVETARRYEPDNTIELQLPFVKHFFPGTRIVPLGLPPKKSSLAVGRRAVEIAVGKSRKTVVIGSTDLTHYGYNYGYVPQGVGEKAVNWVKNDNDQRMVSLMKEMEGEAVIQEALKNQNACCSGAVGASIAAARALGARRGKEITYATSYDIRPDNSFVGYVGIVFQA